MLFIFTLKLFQSYRLPAFFKAKNISFFLAFFCVSCSFQTYQAKPINPQAIAEKLDKKSPTDDNFLTFLLNKGYTSDELPIKSWDLNALIDCALYFHPSLDVARAQWKAAQASEATISGNNMPIINANIAHSNRANGDINPFAYQFSIDIPINTQNKREIQIESFSHLTEAAKLEVAQTAWTLRHNVVLSVNEIQWLETQADLLDKEIAFKQEIVSMLEQRKQLGLASSLEVNQANLQLLLSKSTGDQLQQTKLIALNTLARNIGLPRNVMNTMHLKLSINANQLEIPNVDIQKNALLNRLDMRIALERYAVTESKVKLEIAKQHPDLTISPGYAYEFGDKVWSLGFSSLLYLLKNNKAAILEAEQLRNVEVAQFEALQADIIGQTNTSNAQLQQAQAHLSAQTNLLKKQQAIYAKTQTQFNAGEIDRLTLTLVKLELINSEKEVAQAEHQLTSAWIELENTLQTPLFKNIHAKNVQFKEIKE